MSKYKSLNRMLRIKEDRKRRKAMASFILSFAVMMISLFGASYALLSKQLIGTKHYTMNIGTLDFEIQNEANSIQLLNAYPMSDEKGKTLTPYTFSIKNTGTLSEYYRITLVEDEEKESLCESCEYLSPNKLRYMLTMDGVDGTVGNVLQTSVLDSGQLSAGVSKKYELRIWLDKKETIAEENKYYYAKIKVEASQEEFEPAVTFIFHNAIYQIPTNHHEAIVSDFSLDDGEETVALDCDNNSVPSYENGQLKISNIQDITSCTTYSSLKEAATELDDRHHHLILINDEEYTDEAITFSNQNATIDLNGHVITFRPVNSTWSDPVSIDNGSQITFLSSKNGGGMIMDVSNTTRKSRTLLRVFHGSQLSILSGYYASNTNKENYATLQIGASLDGQNTILNIDGQQADNCTENISDYHTGLCIYSNQSAAVKKSSSSQTGQLNIYGGSFVSNNYAYMTDATGGETNIYGGYFKGANYSIWSNVVTAKTTINICGGIFDSPTDILSSAQNSMIYYKNSDNISWKNGDTPSIVGDYPTNVQQKDDLVCE